MSAKFPMSGRSIAAIVLAAIVLALSGLVFATAAFAHAKLLRAVPAVGSTVKEPPTELQLRFSEGIEPRFSSLTLSGQAGAVSVGRLSVGPPNASVVTVTIGKPLKPGMYVVTWRATSVDSHKTQGSYRFTVAP